MSNLASLAHYSATYAITFLLSFQLQLVLHLNAASTGFILLIHPITMSICSTRAGSLADRHDIWNDSDELDNQTLKKFTEKYIDASQKGMIPKYLESMIASLKKSLYELPWNLYLKKMMGSITCDRKKTTTRRNRRQPERLDLPGHLKNHKAKIIIAIDISGSISDGEFKQAMTYTPAYFTGIIIFYIIKPIIKTRKKTPHVNS